MANATDIVKKGTTRVTDEFTKQPLVATAADRFFWPNSMLGKNAAGYVDKFDDTQALNFAGVFRGQEGKFKHVISSAGDYSIDIHRTPAFELAISGVTVADVGRRVYALDDQTGTLSSSATTYANLVGVVREYVASGIALVEPIYEPPVGEALQVLAANGAVNIKAGTVVITKGTAAAITIADPTSGLHDGMKIDIVSTTAAAHTLTFSATGANNGGAATDVGTFGAAIGNGIAIVAYAGKWYVTRNIGVTLA